MRTYAIFFSFRAETRVARLGDGCTAMSTRAFSTAFFDRPFFSMIIMKVPQIPEGVKIEFFETQPQDLAPPTYLPHMRTERINMLAGPPAHVGDRKIVHSHGVTQSRVAPGRLLAV